MFKHFIILPLIQAPVVGSQPVPSGQCSHPGVRPETNNINDIDLFLYELISIYYFA